MSDTAPEDQQETRVFDYLTSLAHKLTVLSVFSPKHILATIVAASHGDVAAQSVMLLIEQSFAAAEGMECICCDAPIDSTGAGGVALLRESAPATSDPATLQCASLPICWACAHGDDVVQLTQDGVKRSLFPKMRVINPNRHPAGHA
jgi:hypothetical protein